MSTVVKQPARVSSLNILISYSLQKVAIMGIASVIAIGALTGSASAMRYAGTSSMVPSGWDNCNFATALQYELIWKRANTTDPDELADLDKTIAANALIVADACGTTAT
jgi:hypothetical protein